jgi:hypothetical protein
MDEQGSGNSGDQQDQSDGDEGKGSLFSNPAPIPTSIRLCLFAFSGVNSLLSRYVLHYQTSQSAGLIIVQFALKCIGQMKYFVIVRSSNILPGLGNKAYKGT